ncbi:MAG: threonylcarbamoyl-AMP synthase [Proteobacteria bacterium]|nr:threonylcarbamoyl-AMP synthase [Pseudomonadota bacterium]
MSILTPSDDTLQVAAAHLRTGGLVGFPTETVYGLGGDATSERAVAAIFELKGRPRFNPLIVHVSNLKMAETLAVFDRRSRFLAQRQWPGPLTMVLKKRPDCPVALLATAGLDTVALRVPDHPVALALIAAVGRPLAGPSANRSGAVSPTTAEHVEREFGRHLPIILDGGACRVGLESTVVDLTRNPAAILRAGGVTTETIAAAIGELADPVPGPDAETAPRAPGQLASHYAPRLKLRLDPTEAQPGEALLAFGQHALEGFEAVVNLSESGNLTEAATRLFAALRELDRPEFSGIAAMMVPERGLGVAINDRLRRAAAPRK